MKKMYKAIIPMTTISLGLAIASPLIFMFTKVGTNGETVDYKNIKKINNILADYECSTMSEVVAVLYANDIDLENLKTLNSTDQYVWDSKANKVIILDKDNKVATAPEGYQLPNKNNIWKMVKAKEKSYLLNSFNNSDIYAEPFKSDTPYSQFLRSNEQFDDQELSFCSGLDTGLHKDMVLTFNENSEEVTEPVIVNTLACSLTVNTNIDKLNHYGSLLDLTITKMDENAEYHEYGKVAGNVILKPDAPTSFVAQAWSEINTIIIDSDYVKSIDVKADELGLYPASVGTIAKTDNCKTEPEITIEEGVEKPDQPDDPVTPPTPGSDDLSGLGTEKSPFIVTSAEDFKKIHEYSKPVADGGKGYSYYRYENSEKYINAEHWEYDDYFGNLYGCFDGNGLVVDKMSRPLFATVGYNCDESRDQVMKISNLTLNCDISLDYGTAAVAEALDCKAVLENIDVHGYITGGQHVGGFVAYGPTSVHRGTSWTDNTSDWKFVNCTCDAMLSAIDSNAFVSGYVGYRYSSHDSQYTFEDCIFNGVINNGPTFTEGETNYQFGNFVSGPVAGSVKIRTKYSEDFLGKYGNPENVYYAVPVNEIKEGEYRVFYTGQTKTIKEEDRKDNYVQDGYILNGMRNHVDNKTIKLAAGTAVDTIEIDKADNAEVAYCSLYISPNGKAEGNVWLTAPFSCTSDPKTTQELMELDQDTNKYKSINVKNYNVFVNESGHETPGVQGNDYNVYDTDSYRTTTNPPRFILAVQYRSNNSGKLVPIHITKISWSNITE